MRTFRLGNQALMAVGLLLSGCPKDKSASVPDATSAPDGQTLADTASNDTIAVADTADATASPDSATDVPPADTSDAAAAGSDATVYTYVPADPCAEEPAAPAEGSTCTTVDELRCSDSQQAKVTSFSFQSESGSTIVQACKRLYVLRCDVSVSGPKWTKYLGEELIGAGGLDAARNLKTEGIWCLTTDLGPALGPGTCKSESGGYLKACPASTWGTKGCNGTTLVACGTPEIIDAMLPATKKPWHQTAAEQLGANFSYCSTFGRRYVVRHCAQERLDCKFKDPKTGQISYPDVPGDCIPDNDTGAHCATTCEEIGMEGPK